MDKQDDVKLGDTAQAVTATTHTESVATAMQSDLKDLPGFEIVGVEPTTATVFDLHIGAKVKWNAVVDTDVTWDTDKVRQGQQLDVARKVALTLGTIDTLWTLSGSLIPFGNQDWAIDIGEIPIGLNALACAPKFEPDGTSYDCVGTSDKVTVMDIPCVPLAPYVKIAMGMKFTITPDGGIVHRSAFIADDELVAAADLDLNTSSLHEQLAMSCSKPAGSSVQYAMDPYTYAGGVHAVQQPTFEIGVHDPGYALGCTQLPAMFEGTWGPELHSDPDLSLHGDGQAIDLGELQANNVLPTISPLGPFSGSEGSPVSFSAQVDSACPITSYVWQFSDGTQSYGPTPQRAFGDDGMFDGQLTVKDATNQSAVGSFDVSIANVKPNAYAGPDTSEMWGRMIKFQGQGVDPGSNDQSTLTYSWNFGDGTPGLGGASVNHAYAQPGDYIATLTVCDDHVCDNDSMNVHIRKRGTTTSYTGAHSGQYSAPANLAASLVDELGKPVPGASVAFTLAGLAMGAAQTDVLGNASKSSGDLSLAAGSFVVGAGFAGSSLYEASSTMEQFQVGQMSSSMQYTGSLQGGPNKSVNLSAKLVDGLGRALAGKQVVFQLGTQQVSASTNASGVASASLKLTQKQGQYPLTATWTPSAGDATKWTGTSTSATFKLQSK